MNAKATVFLSGSQTVTTLDAPVRQRLRNIIANQLNVVVGDCDGVDALVQTWFRDAYYRNVTVFCSGACRNNVGLWPVRKVDAPASVGGRAYHLVKDRKMAEQADFGLAVWNGRSVGTIRNIVQLASRGKISVVYLAPRQTFLTVKTPDTLRGLLEHCRPSDAAGVMRSPSIRPDLETLGIAPA